VQGNQAALNLVFGPEGKTTETLRMLRDPGAQLD